MKEKTDAPSIDAFMDTELNKEKQVVKTQLTIPYSGKVENVALRVADSIYASTRLGTLQKTDDGFEVDVTGNKDLPGKKYLLNEAGTGKLLQTGKIQQKAAAAKVLEFQKTGTK